MDSELIFTEFCDLNIFIGSRKEFVNLFLEDMQRGGPARIVFSVNGQGLSDYHLHAAFRDCYQKGDYIHADGMSIVFGTKLFGSVSCKERIATTDWVHDVMQDPRCQDARHYFLGAEQESLETAVEKLHQRYPDMSIAGYHHGYFSLDEEPEIIQEINDSAADILWLGLGRPRQEHFAVRNRDALNVVWIKTCGGLFDFLSEKNKRAPDLLQKMGLEWLYRLAQEPRRLLSRYFISNVVSVVVMMREGLRNMVKK